MDFSLSKQDQLFLQMIREFAEKEVKIPDGNRSKNGKTWYYGYPIPG